MSELFENLLEKPLADILRPKCLTDVIGQDHLLAKGNILSLILNNRVKYKLVKKIPSIIFWGDPGCGKTTISRLIADKVDAQFISISAVFSGVSDLKNIFKKAITNKVNGLSTILFVDEIHRFNRSQQDSFLPYVEDGTIILIGATTENPSFELNTALLSRMQILKLNRLDAGSMQKLLIKAENYLEKKLPLNDEAKNVFITIADGDGRYFLNMVDILMQSNIDNLLNVEQMFNIIQCRLPIYDNKDNHYNLLSAFHKSVRGSDVQASLYWMGRMLSGGENPLSIARRMLCIAYEDIGLADPVASQQAILAWDTFKRLGSPEGERALVQACIYLATSPKSNTVDKATKSMMKAGKYGSYMPPKNILNAPTKMMKEMDYGKDYKYDHNYNNSFSGQNFFPKELERLELYNPNDRGFEREIKKRFDYYEKLRQGNKNKT